jgi:hypothetical protein
MKIYGQFQAAYFAPEIEPFCNLWIGDWIGSKTGLDMVTKE